MTKLTLSLALVLSLAGANAYAAQSAETIACAETIEKESTRFQKAVFKHTLKCIEAIEKCDSNADCQAKLLRIDATEDGPKAKGKCTVGKLDEGELLAGDNSSQFALDSNRSKVGRAHYRFVSRIGERCFLPGVVFTGVDGIGHPAVTFTPANLNELMNQVNNNSKVDGVACLGIEGVKTAIPGAKSLVLSLFLPSPHPVLANLAFAPIMIADDLNYCLP